MDRSLREFKKMEQSAFDVVIEISDINNRWNKLALEESAKQQHPLGQPHGGMTDQNTDGRTDTKQAESDCKTTSSHIR